MNLKRTFMLAVLIAVMGTILSAQTTRQFGVIRGVVSDPDGQPLPGVTVTATSPALLGSIADVTGSNGVYRCPSLPPGVYTVTAEIPGFNTVKQEGIDVRVGIILTVNFAMEPTTIAEEVTVVAASPTVDVQSLKLVTRVDSETLQKLPIDREFANIVGVAAGVVEDFSSSKMTGMGTGIIHGGTAYGQSFEVDGVNVVDPAHAGAILFTPQYDAIEEVSIETGGLEAQVGGTSGNFINIVTKSGGNEFHGAVTTFYTQEDMTQILIPEEQLTAMGFGKPQSPIFDYDISGSLGGPIIRDKLWFFTTLAYENAKNRGPFIPTTIQGKFYDQYDVPNSFKDVMLKLSAQVADNMRLYVTGGFSEQDFPIAYPGTRSTLDAVLSKADNRRMTASGQFSWHISSNSILDIRAGISRFDYPILYRDQANAGIGHFDAYTGYTWRGGWAWASDIDRNTKQVSARMTHFEDDFLGGNHEIGVGVEYQYGREWWAWFRDIPILSFYYNGNPYYWRGLFGLDEPHPVRGDGYLLTQACGPTPGETVAPAMTRRFGAYVQDAWTINNRLTITLGVRIDDVKGWISGAKKERAGGIVPDIGAYYLEPVYGFNPLDKMETPDWDPAMKWSPISPRIGVSYDVFGDGKTAIKASYSKYAENMPAMYFQGNHPFSMSQWGWNPLWWNWWDLNGNQDFDAPPTDQYQLWAGAVSDYDPDPATYHQKIDADIKAPTYNEFIFGVEHELFRNFNVGAKFFYRNKKGTLDTVLYDRATQRPWYTYDQAPDWWVPFTTVVPGVDDYPEQEVTMYLISKSAPWNDRFFFFTNVEESKRVYQAFEITFDKRFSEGWALGGSFVYSKLTGNVAGTGGVAHGFSSAFDNPNYFVNRDGRQLRDRPLAVKAYGVFQIPFGFIASFYYTHFSGFPFQRTVFIIPPSDWAAANNALPNGFSVNVEQQGSRREQSVDNVDFRIEREFGLGDFGKLGLHLDIYNLLGNRYAWTQVDPGGTWIPSGAGTNAGTYLPAGNYGLLNNVQGVRIFKVSARLTF